MMTHWTLKRKASFWIHTAIVIVPFLFSTISAWSFWFSLFNDPVIASAMIAVIDVLALLGLILYIARVDSPFQALRHVLPFISVVPLGIELDRLLLPNGVWIAGAVALLSTAIMVAVAALCFRTIERLFISPLDAAREKAAHDVASLVLALEQFQVVSSAVEAFRSGTTSQVTVDESTVTLTTPSKTKQVAQLAAAAGVSVSTMWRRVQKGEVVIAD